MTLNELIKMIFGENIGETMRFETLDSLLTLCKIFGITPTEDEINSVLTEVKNSDRTELLKRELFPDGYDCTVINRAVNYIMNEILSDRIIEELINGLIFRVAEKFGLPTESVVNFLKRHSAYPSEEATVFITENTVNELCRMNGDTYVNEYELVKTLKNKGLADEYSKYKKLSKPLNLIIENGRLSSAKYRDAEAVIAQRIHTLSKSVKSTSTDISAIEKSLKINLDNKQKEAVSRIDSSGVFVICGGAGTGKTTALSAVVSGFLQNYGKKDILLIAPTARAAARITDAMNGRIKAKTIHAALGYSLDCTEPKYNGHNKFTHKLIIVDETSMCDIFSIKDLLLAIDDASTVVLVGDNNQLQSVESGAVLRDIIISETVPVVFLEKNHRSGGTILNNAEKILKGDKNLVQDDSFEVILCENDSEILEKAVSLSTKETEIITTANKGICGTDNLNIALKNKFNPSEDTFSVNDKVLFCKNNYQSNYINGDIGTVEAINKNYITVNVAGKKIKTDKDLRLAYAITVYKAQGAEYSDVIAVLSSEFTSLLNKSMLYTAITRAKSKITVITTEEALNIALKTDSADRKTNLRDFLKGEFPNG